jgi:hypothetical protein
MNTFLTFSQLATQQLVMVIQYFKKKFKAAQDFLLEVKVIQFLYTHFLIHSTAPFFLLIAKFTTLLT